MTYFSFVLTMICSVAHTSSTYEITVDLVGHLVWPIVVVFIIWIFARPAIAVMQSLRRIRYGDFAFELEERESTGDDKADLLKSIVERSPHSYQWIRQNTSLRLLDGEFDKLIAEHPSIFERATIIRRDEQGKRLEPGWPGVKLKS